MSNFSVNTNFNNIDFNNSIQEFNKSFQNSNNVNDKSFEELFNEMTTQQNPIQGNVNQTVNLDIKPTQKIENISPSAKVANDIGKGFSDSINDLNTITRKAEDDFETFASGGDISVHDVMISAQKSNLAMQMAIQLRNQMINAYNEFKNLSI